MQPHHVHAETQCHPGHLGTGLPARAHAVLSPEQVAALRAATAAFGDRFGYPQPP